MTIKDRFAIAGVGYTPQGRVPGRTSLSFHLEACANAIDDAGVRKELIDGLICYRHFPASSDENDLTPFHVAQHLGISPGYIGQETNCARNQLMNALGALNAGLCNYVLISFGHNAKSSDSILRLLDEYTGDDAVFGHFGATGSYALAARRAMHEYRTGPDTWKYIATGQRKWANLNPSAMMYKNRMTEEDYLNYEWFVEPFRLPDNCLLSDGGRAVLVTTVERALDLKQKPAVIMGIGAHNPSVDFKQFASMGGPTGAKAASEAAFAMAGISIGDVDACQIYDCFTYTVEVTLQDYGFFKPGEGEDWFRGGTIAPGGRMPVNTSGGLLSEAYFMGLTPLSESAMQIMGRCGQRQLGPATGTKEPGIIICSDNGGFFQSHSCCILRRM